MPPGCSPRPLPGSVDAHVDAPIPAHGPGMRGISRDRRPWVSIRGPWAWIARHLARSTPMGGDLDAVHRALAGEWRAEGPGHTEASRMSKRRARRSPITLADRTVR